ncbi:hypothetical protein CERZMDRAFT_108995 [Cercospora zeae-maydis SCOH1-5]|uniref:Sulfotransferase domain-containing protein n=1 Tax=Cercospora zeae-maydis SCOH1-5 TaxID=717836 RepID=A0A6A6FUT2_9PEZI|nr:hypothetical protein CERZMDRAFT_108995 [Cercospora zeae-maydis SCOH1-5]
MSAIRFKEPKPGAKLQVIGAGLPRTGTNSFCAALEILLDGPCYHSGVQYAAEGAGDEKHIRAMMEAAGGYPYDSTTWPTVATTLRRILEGYVAVADPPLSVLYPELLKLYPDAKVIVTVRDRKAWMRSMTEVIKLSQPKLATFIFWWVPSVRWLPKLSDDLTHLFFTKFGIIMKDEETFSTCWEKHIEQLQQTVPENQLFFLDVKDGWEPLCKALDKPIPDVPFPKLNDAKDLESVFKKLAARGLIRWALLFTVLLSAACFATVTAPVYLDLPRMVTEASGEIVLKSGIGLLLLVPILLLYI